MADMEHEQCYKSAITITEQHTEYTRRGELRHPGLARDAARGSSRSRAMDGSVQQSSCVLAAPVDEICCCQLPERTPETRHAAVIGCSVRAASRDGFKGASFAGAMSPR